METSRSIVFNWQNMFHNNIVKHYVVFYNADIEKEMHSTH